MRNRIEDLGRLLVLLEDIIETDMFFDFRDELVDRLLPAAVLRNDDYEMYIDRASDLENQIAFVKEKLYKCIDIAKGNDYLNLPEIG